MKKQLDLLLILFTLLLFTTTTYARKGMWLGIQGNYGFVQLQAKNTTISEKGKIYGGAVVGEYNFTDNLGIAYSLGGKNYEFNFINSSSIPSTIDMINIYQKLTFRLRPLPWLIEKPSFDLYFGVGGSIEYFIITEKEISAATQSAYITYGYGLVLEAGLGYYITDKILLSGGFKFTKGLTNIFSYGWNSSYYTGSEIEIKPTYLELNLSIKFLLF